MASSTRTCEITASRSLLVHQWLGYTSQRSLVTVQDDGTAHVSLVNLTGFSQRIYSGTAVGTISEIEEEIQFAASYSKSAS